MPDSSNRVRHRLTRIVAALGLCAAMAGCGQKGPLFLPTAQLHPTPAVSSSS